jgi:hypothetical protein
MLATPFTTEGYQKVVVCVSKTATFIQSSRDHARRSFPQTAFSEAALFCQRPVVRCLSLAVPPWVRPFCRAPSLERVERSATNQDALRSTLRTSDDCYPCPRIDSYELTTRMAVFLCEANGWGLRRFAVSSARFLTLLFALVMASIARRRRMSMRRAGGAIYRSVLDSDQGGFRAHRTHSSNLTKDSRTAPGVAASGHLLDLAM